MRDRLSGPGVRPSVTCPKLLLVPCIAAAAVLWAACRPGSADPGAVDPSSPPTLQELASATYLGIMAEPVTLDGGRWEGEPFVEGGASRPTLGLVAHFALDGDMDGDGRPETAVLLWSSSGGSGTRTWLAVMGRRDGRVVNLGTALVGDRTQVRWGRLADGHVRLELVQAGPADPTCCPTQLASASWRLRNGVLERTATEVTGTLSVAELEGAEWILEELPRGQPVPRDVHITLQIEEDRLAGSTGCNRYFATVSSPVPGELALSAAGVTRRACPEPAMTLEQHYLEALGSASRYSFNGGRLVIDGDGAEGPQSLLFRRAGER